MMEKANKKVSESKREAIKKFDAKTYTYRSIKFRNEELEAILNYCKKHNLSINGFMRETLMRAIEEDK